MTEAGRPGDIHLPLSTTVRGYQLGVEVRRHGGLPPVEDSEQRKETKPEPQSRGFRRVAQWFTRHFFGEPFQFSDQASSATQAQPKELDPLPDASSKSGVRPEFPYV